jgi:hypothetical protein
MRPKTDNNRDGVRLIAEQVVILVITSLSVLRLTFNLT